MNFDERVWNLCKKIPRGKVSTYKLIAEELNSKAYRAVGGALNRNPYAPQVPCHRVLNSKGELHGFAFGLEAKKKLLENEGIKIKNNKVVDFEKVLFRFNRLYTNTMR